MTKIDEFETKPYGKGFRYNLPTDKEINNFERIIHHSIPIDYSIFLKRWNGGLPKYDLLSYLEWEIVINNFYHLSLDELSIKEDTGNILWQFQHLKSVAQFQDLLPIAKDGEGNLLLINLKSTSLGKILYWDHEKNTFIQVANTFNHLVDQMYGHIFDPDL
jgi:hypothetical protein